LNTINSSSTIDGDLIRNLRYSWGNSGFSAKSEYINTLIKYSKKTDGLILECGSGLSTLLIAPIAKMKGIQMISLEHNEFWANRVKNQLDKYNLRNSKIYLRPLIQYENFDWYDVANDNDIKDIALCICDAPPGKTRGGRKGFLYLLHNKLATNSVVLVDDTVREEERSMINEWKSILDLEVDFKGIDENHAILRFK